MNLEKDFVPHEPSLALKELGFDEPCLAHLIGFGDGTIENGKYVINYQQVFYPNAFIEPDDKAEELGLHPFGICGVPLYQQAFRWFREKYELVVDWNHRHHDNFGSYIGVCIKNIHLEETIVGAYKTHEEAELACLIKLIEIVKEKKNG